MSQDNKNDAFAFPYNEDTHDQPDFACNPGLTKRELYATMAMHGVLSSVNLAVLNAEQTTVFGKHMVAMCWRVADDMCKQAQKVNDE